MEETNIQHSYNYCNIDIYCVSFSVWSLYLVSVAVEHSWQLCCCSVLACREIVL